jgi:hypothetical protein
MSDVQMVLDGVPLTVAPDGRICGEHELVEACNIKVSRTAYTPNRQQTAVTLLQRLGGVLAAAPAGELFTYPADFDPFVWY